MVTRSPLPHPPPGRTPGGTLRAVLSEVRAAGGGEVDLTDLADRVGVSRAEVASMVDYWVRRGSISPAGFDLYRSASCTGCVLRRTSGCASCPPAGHPTAGGRSSY